MGKEVYESIIACIENGDDVKMEEVLHAAMKEGFSSRDIIQESFIPAMNAVSKKYRNNELFAADVIMSSEAMKTALNILYKENKAVYTKAKDKILIGTVKHDVHDLGKTIVICSLLAAGFCVTDAGVDVDPEDFVKLLKEEKPALVMLSCTLSYILPELKETINVIRSDEVGKKIKIIVGGLALNRHIAAECGADAYAINEEHAVILAEKFLQEK
jgi:5-methyltetrahydrofolate--homocysteine methyltransferase